VPVVARRWLVRGRVQGVGFRAFVRREAAELGVRGWVRNLADGGVEAYAAGTAEQLNALQGRLWAGPRWAEVRGVEPFDAPVDNLSSTFQIR
jgi:acylphosphatase